MKIVVDDVRSGSNDSSNLNQLCADYRNCAEPTEKRRLLGQLQLAGLEFLTPVLNRIKIRYSIRQTVFDERMDDAAVDLVKKLADREDTRPESFHKLLATSMSNLAIDVMRKAKRERNTVSMSSFGSDDNGDTPFTGSEGIDFDYIDTRSSDGILAQIRPHLGTLDVRYIETLSRSLDGQPYQTIADEMNTPLGTVKSRLAVARKALRRAEFLSEYAEDLNDLPRGAASFDLYNQIRHAVTQLLEEKRTRQL